MKVLTGKTMREADRLVIQEMGLPGAVLMETAAMRAAEVVTKLDFFPGRVVVAAGPGNNGGDGLALARQLQVMGYEISLWSTVAPGEYRGDSGINETFLIKSNFSVNRIGDEDSLSRFNEELSAAGLVVDALLGTGVNRPVKNLLANTINQINKSGKPVLSLDLPSGVNSEDGVIMGCAIQADWTVTFAFPKLGLLLDPGAGRAGQIIVGDIHIPPGIISGDKMELSSAGDIKKMLPWRPRDVHKGRAGKVLLVGGSIGMSGAPLMAGAAAMHGGAGLVYLAVPSALLPAVESRILELIVLPLPGETPGIIGPAAAEELLNLAEDCDVLALGPGLSPAVEAAVLLDDIIKNSPVPVVLDAGALGALEGRVEIIRQAAQPVIITPHAGEMAKLTGISPEEIQHSRLEIVRKYARKWKCVVLLKGPNSMIGLPDGRIFFNTTGGPSLATAGTGDLLTGLVASFIAQGLPPEEAVRAGAYLHGLAGDMSRGFLGRVTTATGVLSFIPAAFKYLEEEAGTPSPWGPFLQSLRCYD